LESIETTGREALTQMRHMLGALRAEDDEAAEIFPQPGLDQLAELKTQADRAGLRTELQVTGNVRAIPTATALSAFRIAQESTTNVIKHASAGKLWISVDYQDETVILDIADDGVGIPVDSERTQGHGLIGMSERVDLLSGQLRIGSRPEGGTLVHAELPIGASTEDP
ncbi:MAG: sensor histidine kinase, partial [Acidimicrobiales bacterium]